MGIVTIPAQADLAPVLLEWAGTIHGSAAPLLHSPTRVRQRTPPRLTAMCLWEKQPANNRQGVELREPVEENGGRPVKRDAEWPPPPLARRLCLEPGSGFTIHELHLIYPLSENPKFVQKIFKFFLEMPATGKQRCLLQRPQGGGRLTQQNFAVDRIGDERYTLQVLVALCALFQAFNRMTEAGPDLRLVKPCGGAVRWKDLCGHGITPVQLCRLFSRGRSGQSRRSLLAEFFQYRDETASGIGAESLGTFAARKSGRWMNPGGAPSSGAWKR